MCVLVCVRGGTGVCVGVCVRGATGVCVGVCVRGDRGVCVGVCTNTWHVNTMNGAFLQRVCVLYVREFIALSACHCATANVRGMCVCCYQSVQCGVCACISTNLHNVRGMSVWCECVWCVSVCCCVSMWYVFMC